MEDDHNFRGAVADHDRRGGAAHVREPEVDQCDVRLLSRRDRRSLIASAGNADYGQVGFGLDGLGDGGCRLWAMTSAQETSQVEAVQVRVGLDRVKNSLPVELPDVVLAEGHGGKAPGERIERDLVSHHLGVGGKSVPLRGHLTHPAHDGRAAGERMPERLLPEANGAFDCGAWTGYDDEPTLSD